MKEEIVASGRYADFERSLSIINNSSGGCATSVSVNHTMPACLPPPRLSIIIISSSSSSSLRPARRPCSRRETCRRQILEQHGPPSECACMVCSKDTWTDRQLLPAQIQPSFNTCKLHSKHGESSFSSSDRDSWICRTGKWRRRTYCTRWSERKLMCTTRNYFTHKSKYISYGYCLRDLEQQCDRQHKLQNWDTWSTVVIVWFLFYHIFNKYNSKCGIIMSLD